MPSTTRALLEMLDCKKGMDRNRTLEYFNMNVEPQSDQHT